MALQQSITNEKGATTTYHRIVKAKLDFTIKEATLIVFSYATESLRQAEKEDSSKLVDRDKLVERLDELVSNPTEENEQERIELSDKLNSSAPTAESASLHLLETEYILPLNDDFSIKDAYKWLKENVFVEATDVQAVTLTVAQIPSHNHKPVGGGDFVGVDSAAGQKFGFAGGNYVTFTWKTGGVTANSGGSSSHNNLQPYITCYFWRRTA